MPMDTYRIYCFHETFCHLILLSEVGNDQALQKRDAETPTYFLIPGYCTEAKTKGQKDGEKVEKNYDNKGV